MNTYTVENIGLTQCTPKMTRTLQRKLCDHTEAEWASVPVSMVAAGFWGQGDLCFSESPL